MTAIVSIPKSTFPFISIPQPGKRPFVYDRRKFTAVLRGINITDWSLSECGEWLEVVHSTRGVRGRYKFRNQLYVIGAYDFRKRCSDWREAEQRRRKATPVKGMSKAAQLEIRKCERELAKYYNRATPAPKCPLVQTHSSDYYNHEWDKQKVDRKKLAVIAGQVITRKLTEGTAYKQIRALGYPLTIQSKLNKHNSAQAATYGYWEHIYEYCGLLRASHWGRKPADELKKCTEHYSRRIEWLNQKRKREELVSRIAAIKAIQLPVEGIQ